MINMIISFMVVVLSFNFFMMSYQVNGLNRLVMNAPISLFETAIELMDINKDKGPIFNKDVLERNLTSILATIQFVLMKKLKRWKSLFPLHLSLLINTKRQCFMKSGVIKWMLIS